MTNKQTLFEGGTQGASLSTTNVPTASQVSGQGAGFNTAIFDAAQAAHGSFGAKFTTVSGGNAAGSLIRIAFTAANNQIAVRAVGTLPGALPAADTIILALRASASQTWRLVVGATGGLYMLDKGNTSTPILTNTQLTALLGGQFTVSIVANGGSTTAGSMTIKIYNAALTLVSSLPTQNAMNLDTNTFAAADWGIIGAPIYSIGWDDIQMSDGATSELAAYTPPANVPPTVTVGANQVVAAGSVASVTSTEADSDGTIASRSWRLISYPGTAPTITGATTPTVSFTPTVQGTYVLGFTATDNGGATSTEATTKVFVRGTAIVPISLTQSVGPWLTSAVGNVSDSSDSTYAESPAPPTSGETTVRYRLAPLFTPSSFPLVVRESITVAGTNTALVRLIVGSTTYKTWTLTLTTTPTDFTLTLTSGEIASVPSWDEVDIEVTYTGS